METTELWTPRSAIISFGHCLDIKQTCKYWTWINKGLLVITLRLFGAAHQELYPSQVCSENQSGSSLDGVDVTWPDVTWRENAVGLTHIVRLGLSLGELVLVQGETGGDPAEPHVPQHVLVICHLPASPRTGAYRKNAPRSDPAELRRQAAPSCQTHQQEPSNFNPQRCNTPPSG